MTRQSACGHRRLPPVIRIFTTTASTAPYDRHGVGHDDREGREDDRNTAPSLTKEDGPPHLPSPSDNRHPRAFRTALFRHLTFTRRTPRREIRMSTDWQVPEGVGEPGRGRRQGEPAKLFHTVAWHCDDTSAGSTPDWHPAHSGFDEHGKSPHQLVPWRWTHRDRYPSTGNGPASVDSCRHGTSSFTNMNPMEAAVSCGTMMTYGGRLWGTAPVSAVGTKWQHFYTAEVGSDDRRSSSRERCRPALLVGRPILVGLGKNY